MTTGVGVSPFPRRISLSVSVSHIVEFARAAKRVISRSISPNELWSEDFSGTFMSVIGGEGGFSPASTSISSSCFGGVGSTPGGVDGERCLELDFGEWVLPAGNVVGEVTFWAGQDPFGLRENPPSGVTVVMSFVQGEDSMVVLVIT